MSRCSWKADVPAVARLLQRRPDLRGIGISVLLEAVWSA